MNSLTKLNEGLKILVGLSIVFVALCLGVVLIHLDNTLKAVDTTITNVNNEIAAADVTRKSIDDLMVQTTVLIVDADTAATKETAVLDSVNAKVTDTLGSLKDSITAFTVNQDQITKHTVQTLDATTKSVAGIQPVLEQAKASLASIDAATKDANKAINNPDIPKIAANVQSMTASGASIVKDGADVVHKVTHPDKKKLGFWGGIWAGLEFTHDHIIPKISIF